jgi:hypothetical protein
VKSEAKAAESAIGCDRMHFRLIQDLRRGEL